MNFKKIDPQSYVVSIEPGEKIIEQLNLFLEKEKITNASFIAIGATDECELAQYTVSKQKYFKKTVTGQHEITNITGNVFLFDGKPLIHAHITISDESFNAYGGHLVEARVCGACEILLKKLDSKIGKKHSEKIGLKLLDL
ncbi:MAG: DNA-binding protein [Nanoarchaeota archaeon]|nr:DNA-binding protein [Nanoarchaeota archaeon]